MRALLLLAALGAGAARAETQVQRACQADYARLCSGGAAAAGGSATVGSVAGAGAAGCLRQQHVSLSRACRSALDAAKKPADPYAERGSRLSPRDASASR